MGNAIIIKGADFSKNALGTITPESGRIAINVIANPAEGGTVTGGGKYDEGSVVQLSAIPSEDYKFKNWNDGAVQQVRSVTVGAEDKTYIANFVEENDLDDISEDRRYFVGVNGLTRTYLLFDFVDNIADYKIKVSVRENSPIKAGIQFYDRTGTLVASTLSKNSSRPKPAPTKIKDEGWILAGESRHYDNTNYNVHAAGALGVGVVFTYAESGSGMPTVEEVRQCVVVKLNGLINCE